MDYKVREDFLTKLDTDIDKKYLAPGLKLSGDIKGEKVQLYLTDDFGKHSNFINRTFYGKISRNTLSGKFRLSNYALIILGALFGVCIESIVSAIIFKGYSSLVLPSVIIFVEIFYFFYIKKLSLKHDSLIKKYLEDNSIEN